MAECPPPFLTEAEKLELCAWILAGLPVPAAFLERLSACSGRSAHDASSGLPVPECGGPETVGGQAFFVREVFGVGNFDSYFPDTPDLRPFTANCSGLLVEGDNRSLLHSIIDGVLHDAVRAAGGIKLIYADPPFAVGADFSIPLAVGDGGDIEVSAEHKAAKPLGSASVCRQTRKASFCESGLGSSALPLEQIRCLTQYHTKREHSPWREADAEGLLKSSKQVRVGEMVRIGPELSFVLTERGDFGRCRVRLRWQGEFDRLLGRYGTLPLPPYIRREAAEADAERYQTTYSRQDKAGSVAAPTAGLHFTPDLRHALEDSGREWAEVTLYVGYGTFSPVRSADIREHPMHAEYVEISRKTLDAVARAKTEGRPVIAVGTTSVRVLEGVWEAIHCPEQSASRVSVFADLPPESSDPACAGWVNCFLYPGEAFHVVDGMITNFHLPGSSLLMLVSAFAGRERILAAYARAIQEGFRFFSYGDAMLIL